MTINGNAFEIQKISGYSTEIIKLKGYLEEIKQSEKAVGKIETPKLKITGYTGEVQQLTNEAKKTSNEYNMWTKIVRQYYAMLDQAKMKMSQLKSETQQTGATQSKISSLLSALKPIVHNITSQCQKLSKSFFNLINPLNYIKKITGSISNKIKGMGTEMKQGLGHVLKYAGALFSLRSIYSTLNNSAGIWLSSQNEGAKQLSTNIDYLKYSLGSTLAPVITYITNLVYNMLKAIQSVVYALFRVNIFANASAKSYGAMAGSAKKAKEETKQLAGIHDEINNIQNNDSSDSGSGGTIAPSFDLSGIDSQLSPLAQKLYDFFKPLKESWDNYGSGLIEQVRTTAGQVGGLIASVWGSFENIITNGTVYTSLELILAIIGNIAEAFANAWNYNGNGDVIIQNLANAFNNLLGAINNVVQSEGFQSWLNWCSDKFREISEKIASIDWQPLINALIEIGTNVGSIALEILSALVDIFKWLVENPTVAEILLAIAIAIGVVSTVLGVLSAVMAVLTPISTALGISIGWLVAIIVGIIAVITLIVLAIMNWDTVMKAITDTWNWICEQAQIIWNAIKDFFIGIWNTIVDFVVGIVTDWIEFQKEKFEFLKNIVVTVFNAVKDFIVNIWNGIVTTISNVWNTIVTKVKEGVSGAWNAITSVFGGIAEWFGNVFRGAWEAVKNVFSKGGAIFDGIKDGILNGLKTIVNAIINGINKVIAIPFNGINTALRAIRSVNIMGLQPFNWVNTIGVPQIPTLAKGGVLYDDTIVRAGEYSGASTNPEIVTPENIMYDTMKKALSESDIGNNNDKPIYLTVNVSNKKLGQILLEDLRNMKRQTGNSLEALVGG
ncbi:MAG: hypothetical protein HFJ34_04735 [Clostridia bacterium]|nr:hypothetical protein [Clostridia bacterium]